MKPGDKFLRKSKYGHVVGVVDRIYTRSNTDIDLGVSYNQEFLVSTNGIEYSMNECYELIYELTPEQQQKLKDLADAMSAMKIHDYSKMDEWFKKI